MSWLSNLFKKKEKSIIKKDEIELIDKDLLLDCKGVTEATLDNLSNNKGDEE